MVIKGSAKVTRGHPEFICIFSCDHFHQRSMTWNYVHFIDAKMYVSTQSTPNNNPSPNGNSPFILERKLFIIVCTISMNLETDSALSYVMRLRSSNWFYKEVLILCIKIKKWIKEPLQAIQTMFTIQEKIIKTTIYTSDGPLQLSDVCFKATVSLTELFLS